MPVFDFQAGVSGAAAGTSVLPGYGTLAGFVIGGFLGGAKKAKAQKRLQKAKQRLRQATSPEFLAQLTQRATPLFREQIAGGAGSAIQGDIANRVGAAGLGNTGVGLAIKGAAAGVPDVLAFQEALGSARQLQARRIQALRDELGGLPSPEEAAGQVGDAFGALGGIAGRFAEGRGNSSIFPESFFGLTPREKQNRIINRSLQAGSPVDFGDIFQSQNVFGGGG